MIVMHLPLAVKKYRDLMNRIKPYCGCYGNGTDRKEMGHMKFNGIIPALVTPLKEDETINIPVLEMLMKALLKQGADGFYVAGATGEGLALRPKERIVLAQESIRIAAGKKPCIIQVASTDFSQAVDLAKHAEAAGASAISATPPLFFGYNETEVYHYYRRLAESVHIPPSAPAQSPRSNVESGPLITFISPWVISFNRITCE